MSYSSEVLADSPIWYGRLGEASGTSAVDASTGGHNGTYNNSPTLGVTGALTSDSNTAATFVAASSQDVRVATFTALNTSTFTLEAWVKTTTGGNVPVVSRQGAAAAAYGMWIDTSGRVQLSIKTGATTSGSANSGVAVVNDGAWHHIAVTHSWSGSSGSIVFYVDGAVDSTATQGFLPTLTRSDGLAVASRGTSPFLGATIDEPAVYNTALSGTRIAAHYTAASAGSSAAAGSGSLSLTGSGIVAATGGGSGALALSGSGTTTAAATAAGSLSLTGSGAADTPGTAGAGSLSLSGTATTAAATTAAAALTLTGAGDTSAPSSGTVSLVMSGIGDTSAPAAGSGALSLSGDGTASLPAGGAGSLTLSGSGTAAARLSYPDTVLADMTVGGGYWRLDETTGTTAADSSGGSHPGTYYGPPLLGELAAIPSGTAVGFNTVAVSDMEVPHYTGLDVTEFTLELWSKHDASYDLPIFSRLGGTLAPYGIWISPFGMAEVRIRTVSGSQFRYAGATSITNLLWRHVVATRDSSGTLSIYVDGALDAQFTGTPAPDTTTAYGLGVGTNGETRAGYFQADEAAFYPTALTSSQVATHYAAAGTASGGAGSLTLSGSGSVIGARSGGSLTLVGAGGFAGSAAGFGSIELLGDGAAVPLFSTDTSNAFDGLQLVCLGTVTIVRPAVTPPSNVAVKYDKALPYPRPVMVGGRPT